MAKSSKKTPKYLQKPSAPTPMVYKAGNPSRQFTILVPVLNKDGTIKKDDAENIVREEVTERYEWNQKHRSQHKAGSVKWTISEVFEGIIFLKCRKNGAFSRWKKRLTWVGVSAAKVDSLKS